MPPAAQSRTAPLAGKVLVLGKDTRSFLASVRSLGRRGLEVHVGWCPADSLALRSRYVRRVHELPDPERDDTWLEALQALLERERFDLVLPTNDPSVVPLQEHRDVLERHAVLALSNREAYEVAYDKLATSALARELGIPVPREVHLRDPGDARRLPSELGWPLVLKPRAAFAFGRRKWEHHVRKARDPRTFETYAEALLAQGDVLVQENVPGVGVGVEVLCREGAVLLAFQHRRVHEPPNGGGSAYRRSVALDPRLLDATKRLMRAVDYTGVAMVEFKLDPATDRWALIEVNGRLWGSLPLAVACGADFPRALYELYVEGRTEFPQTYRQGLHARNLVMDLSWQIQNLKSDRADPELATLPLPRVAAEVWNVLTLRERFDTLTRDDPRPGLGALARVLRVTGDTVAGKVRELAWRLGPLRRLAARRLSTALEEARSVLFVCKGNVCRSPLAEALAHAALPGKEVRSAGYYPASGRRCPREALAAALALGVDLSGHRSRVLTPAMVAGADLILVFDRANRAAVLHRFPEARGKTYRVGLLATTGRVDVRDPYGGELADYERSYALVDRALRPAETVAVRVVEP